MSFDLRRVIRPEVQAMSAYHAPPPTGGVQAKLDANESPFMLAETLREDLAAEVAKALADVELHRYPDPAACELREILAGDLGVLPEQILVTNGSDEAIQLLLLAVAGPAVSVAAPVPTFVMYELGARVLGLTFTGVPLSESFDLVPERFRQTLETVQPKLVFLAWPNNPTGRLFDATVVEEIIQRCGGLVAVDEAYTDYSGRTFLPRLREYPNLVILRTLSKIGLAGIRVGMLIGSLGLIEELNKVRLPYNVNALSQAVGGVVLRHADVVRRRAATIVRERERVLSALQGQAGVTAYPSDANFFLMRTGRPGDEIFGELLARGILVRNFSRAPHLADCLRVTIGTRQENDLFLSALGDVLSQGR
jgi:histidinol-phosphate aminotransferase